MPFQADLLAARVLIPQSEEPSAIGADYMAGIAEGIWDKDIFDNLTRTVYKSGMDAESRERRLTGWQDAVALISKRP